MIKRIFKIILKIVLVCFLVFVVLVFTLVGYYIFYKQSENKKTNKIDWPDHVYLTPRTKAEKEQILRGEYDGIDNIKEEDVQLKVLDNNKGTIDRHLGERSGHKLNNWQYGDDTEMWGSYMATLEDVVSWPVGPHGWQEPPEDFKIRTNTKYAWRVNVEIDGKVYALHGSDKKLNHNRRISICDNTEYHFPSETLLLVDEKNKTDWIHLLALAIGNDKIVDGITGGMPIKNNVN